MKTKLLPILILICAIAKAQFANFESLNLEPESFWAGQDGSADYFEDSDFYFPSNWDTSFGGYWLSGWAYSNMTDSVTSGYGNQFSCKAGSGYAQSSNYAIALGDGYFLVNGWEYNSPDFMRITNTTYAHNSMRDGDAFAKKFGGLDGNDPDYFYVEFRAYHNGIQAGDSIRVYLADFTSSDNSEDYILSDWTSVDLWPLGLNTLDVDSVAYTFHSSDVGEFGINTPKYFCIDNLNFLPSVNSINNFQPSQTRIFPNPASGYFAISGSGEGMIQYRIIDISGKLLIEGKAMKGESISTGNLPNGNYLIQILEKNSVEYLKLIISN